MSKFLNSILRRLAKPLAVLICTFSTAFLVMVPDVQSASASLVIEWDASPSPNAIGYILYYGTNSGEYFDALDIASGTAAFIPGLETGLTYYFTATAYTEDIVESEHSFELAHTIPGENAPPKLDPVADYSVNEDSGRHIVTLTGLGGGAAVTSNLIITAASGNPLIVPHPVVANFLPSAGTAELRITPASNAFGPVSITVAVNNQQPVNNFISRSFTINLVSVNDPPSLQPLTNITIAPGVGTVNIPLQGIGSGAPNESQPLIVTASSSNPALIPTPSVAYYSPSASGTLTLRPNTNLFGTSTISVTVGDNQSVNGTTTRTFIATIPGPAETHFIEAESGSVTSPMIIAASTNASNGRYVYSQSADYGTVLFRLTNSSAGEFIIWCRILSPNQSQDSFYVSVDGGSETIYRTAPNLWSTAWQWTRVNIDSETINEELVFPLAAGPHTFRFRSREASTLLDSLYITNNRDFVPVKLNVARRTTPQPATELSFQTAGGFRYALETSTNFTTWTTLWNIPTNIPTARILTYTNTILANTPRRAYRVRVNP